MRRPRLVILALGFAIAAGGAGIAVAQSTHSAPTTATPTAQPAAAGAAGSAGSAGAGGLATINVTTATVLGRAEEILADAHGLPLYTYNLDTAKQSRVDAGLARLWPRLVSGSPTENGATGKLGVITDPNGQQVQYNGHFLYTFIKDAAGEVTGQGVAGFFVATPNLTNASSPTPAPPAPPAATSTNPYRY